MLALGQKEAADIVAAADHLIGIGLGLGRAGEAVGAPADGVEKGAIHR